ncbi:MAG: hypothetical protein GY830_10130 [Bacteroidetes bacterium]|nr:hypothetical protein [Bacteroidota bacterium]
MSLYKFIKLNHNTSYLIWYINESEEFLFKKLKPFDYEYNEFVKIENENLRRVWLAERVALKELFRIEKYPYLGLIKKGEKHYINGLNINISISNNSIFAIACLDKERPIGIDISKIDPELLQNRHKFLNKYEKDIYTDNIEELSVFLSTKKAVYSAYEQDYISLKNDIILDIRPKEKIGLIKGVVNYQPFVSKYCSSTFYVISLCRKLLRIW